MRIILASIGTAGDHHPLLGIGRCLKRRGHNVTFLANAYFAPAVERAGLGFHSIGDEADYREVIASPALFGDGLAGLKLLSDRLAGPAIRPTFEFLKEQYEAGPCVVVALVWAFGARVAQDKLGLPLVTLHLQPTLLPTLHDMPTIPTWIPKGVRSAGRRVMEHVFDGVVCGPLNTFRAEIGLPPARRVLWDWMHSPQRIIGLFPEWYAPPQPDWPAHARQTGFPLYDEGDVQQLSPEAEAFLGEGPPPIVFTPGSGMRHGHRFFAASAEACRRLGRRGMLLTPFAEQIPVELPEGVRHFPYLPFSRVLPHAAALVHHGGVGTMSQALAAGVPQLITPYAFDQPDTAARIRRLGVGDAVSPRNYSAETATTVLKRLLSSEAAAVKAGECADRVRQSSPLDATCRLIEEVGASDSLEHQ